MEKVVGREDAGRRLSFVLKGGQCGYFKNCRETAKIDNKAANRSVNFSKKRFLNLHSQSVNYN